MTRAARWVARSMGVGLALASLAGPTPADSWQRSLGRPENESLRAVESDQMGGVIAVGAAYVGPGDRRARACRFDADGQLIWSRLLSLRLGEFWDILRLADGSFVAVGGAILTPSHQTAVVLRFDLSGNVLWERRLDATVGGQTLLSSVALAADGTLLMGGRRGGAVDWPIAVGMTTDGDLTWLYQLELGGTFGQTDVVPTSDGGFLHVLADLVVVGQDTDAWLVKFNALRQIEWQYSYGEVGIQGFHTAIERPDGTFTVVGAHGPTDRGYDTWIASISALGDLDQQWKLSGTDGGRCVKPTPDGGCLIAGITSPPIRGVLIKLDPLGSLEWSVTHGASSELFEGLAVVEGGEAVAVGRTSRIAAGNGDSWIVRVDSAGAVSGACWNSARLSSVVPTNASRSATTVSLTTPVVTVSVDTDVTFDLEAPPEVPWCTPDEIVNLRASRTATEVVLTWDPDPLATTYELHRGNVSAFDTGIHDHGSIGACGLIVTMAADPVILDGASYYYLAVGRNAAGRSPFGYTSTGALVRVGSPACP